MNLQGGFFGLLSPCFTLLLSSFLLIHLDSSIKICSSKTSMATFRERLELYPHGQWHVGARFVFEHEWEPEEKHRCRRHSSSSSSSSASSHQEGEKRICHFQDFPKALGTILDTLKVRDFRLQLGRGTWDDDVWGRDPDGGIATGAELWARFAADGATEAWKGLTEALGGLYCASLGMMDESRTVRPTLSDIYTDGWETSGNHGADDRSSTVLLRGFLPREAVCTENLTPLVKSLPCRNHAGLGALLHPTRIFSAAFYGLTVSARAEWDGDTPTRLILSQTVHAVWFKLPSELEEIYSSPRGWDLTSFLIPSSAQSASSKPVPGVSILDRCWHSDRLEVRVHGHPVAWGSPPHVVKSLTLDDGDEPLRLREGVGGRLLPPISTRDLLGHLSMDHYLSGKGGIEGWSVSVMRNAGPVERKVAYSQAIPGIMEPLFSTSQLTVGSQQIPLIVSGKRGSSEEEREGKSAAMHISLSSSCASGGHGPWLLELETTIPPESSVTFAFKVVNQARFITLLRLGVLIYLPCPLSFHPVS